MAMLWALLAALVCDSVSTRSRRLSSADLEPVAQPKMVVPGDWLTDDGEAFLFLPFSTPENVPAENCKLMSNGDQILVVVTESPQEEPETNALKKYKLVLEALKIEAGQNEDLLATKLESWLQTEDDEEVQEHIREALVSVKAVMAAKLNTEQRELAVRLGLTANSSQLRRNGTAFLSRIANANFTQRKSADAEERAAEHALTSLHRLRQRGGSNQKVGIIKESFAVEIPYPAPVERMFAIKVASTLIAAMPLDRHSLEAKGISTGGKAFERLPVFSLTGERLAGPVAVLKQMAFGLNIPSLADRTQLKPLPDV